MGRGAGERGQPEAAGRCQGCVQNTAGSDGSWQTEGLRQRLERCILVLAWSHYGVGCALTLWLDGNWYC